MPRHRAARRQARRRALVIGAALLTAVVLLVITLRPSSTHAPTAGSNGASTTNTPGAASTAARAPGSTTTASKPATHTAGATPGVPVTTEIATLNGATPAYGAPNGPQIGTVPATWGGGVSSLPVLGSTDGWLLVSLAQPIGGPSAWISDSAVTLVQTSYYIVVQRGAHLLQLFDAGHSVLSASVDLGTASAPTPFGRYFVAFFAQPPNSTYGPFVIVTSAQTNSPGDWVQGGMPVVTIRGPLADDAAIGTTGTNRTGGSIGMHVADLSALRPVPAGTIVDIRD